MKRLSWKTLLLGSLLAAGQTFAGEADSERVALRTREGFYVRAVRGGGDDLDAKVKEPKTSEVFTLVRQ